MTTFMSDNSLERTHRTHWKLLYLKFITGQECRLKLAKRKRHMGRFSRGPNIELPVIISQWIHDLATVYDSTQRILPTREIYPSLWCLEFFGGTITNCLHG